MGTCEGGTISSGAAVAGRLCKNTVIVTSSLRDAKVTPVPTAHCVGHHGMSTLVTLPSADTEAML